MYHYSILQYIRINRNKIKTKQQTKNIAYLDTFTSTYFNTQRTGNTDCATKYQKCL